jgi:hypothetical protein
MDRMEIQPVEDERPWWRGPHPWTAKVTLGLIVLGIIDSVNAISGDATASPWWWFSAATAMGVWARIDYRDGAGD